MRSRPSYRWSPSWRGPICGSATSCVVSPGCIPYESWPTKQDGCGSTSWHAFLRILENSCLMSTLGVCSLKTHLNELGMSCNLMTAQGRQWPHSRACRRAMWKQAPWSTTHHLGSVKIHLQFTPKMDQHFIGCIQSATWIAWLQSGTYLEQLATLFLQTTFCSYINKYQYSMALA